jgi:hypothetical protein
MRYDAGVEEFIGLVRAASYVVTNSYHGMIVSFHSRRPFKLFSREQCDTKIEEIASVLDIRRVTDGYVHDGAEKHNTIIQSLISSRASSVEFLKQSLERILDE